MQNKKTLIIKVLSVVLPLVALAFVAEKIWSVRTQILNRLDLTQSLILIFWGSILYAIDSLFLVLAWKQLVDWFSETQTSFLVALKIYGRTQIVKYIPGNIFHLPTRHILGRQVGLNHIPLLGATIFEIVGLILVASMISLFGFLASGMQIIQPAWVFIYFFLVAISPLLLWIIFSKVPILHRIGLRQKSISEMS